MKYTNLIFILVINILSEFAYGDVEFNLYTRENSISPAVLTTKSVITVDNFPSNKNITFFVVHGFKSDGNTAWTIEMKDALLTREDANVIIVDWSYMSQGHLYIQSRKSVKEVGQTIASFIKLLELSPKKVHCIGHSLGAHVCGCAGKESKLARISGLDPAGPGFRFGEDETLGSRLSKNDADFVDIVHTSKIFGNEENLGHLDFYANDGTNQPNCGIEKAVCSHGISHTFFTESIKSNCKFTSKQCNSYSDYKKSLKTPKKSTCTCCGFMGYDAPSSNLTGTFYLKTNENSPYCMN